MKQGPAVQFYYEDGDMKLSKLGNDNKNEWDVDCSDLTNVRICSKSNNICYYYNKHNLLYIQISSDGVKVRNRRHKGKPVCKMSLTAPVPAPVPVPVPPVPVPLVPVPVPVQKLHENPPQQTNL